MYKNHNAEVVLENVKKLLEQMEEEKEKYSWRRPCVRTREVCDDLSIFDWWVDSLSMSHLKKMEDFLREAIRNEYTGYVCFKVGAHGCANGMWAHKAESEDGFSPDGAFLYHSFTPDYTCWSVADDDGKTYPVDDEWNTCKTKRQVRELIAQVKAGTVPKQYRIKVTFINGFGAETWTRTREIKFEDGVAKFENMYSKFAIPMEDVISIEKVVL